MNVVYRDNNLGENWKLPKKYNEMTNEEKSKTLKTYALKFLKQNGPGTTSQIQKALGAPNNISLKKALDNLAFTSAIYKESWGGRETTYFPNGRLAHALAHGSVKCGSYKEYSLRTYIDRLTGKHLTITEYSVSPSGRREPKGGIRIDLVDLDKFIAELKRIKDELESSDILDRGIISR